jgi:tol-pal system protein YbgF
LEYTKTMAMIFRQSVQAAALVAAVCFAGHASAQNRLSLADRVNRLEQQVQGGNTAQQTQTELLNRITELQSEVQNLRGLVEQQSFELEGLKKRSRDQYLDLDSRLQVLSSGAAAVPSTALPVESGAGSDTLMSGEPSVAPPPLSTGAPLDSVPLVPAEPVADAAQQRADYDRAFESLKQGQYAEASRQFAAFIRSYPDGELVDNATYWLGESYYVTQNYKIALDTFQQLLSRYPNSGKSADALLKVGYCHHELGDSRKAQETLRSVIQRYPDTPVGRLAQSRLRALELEAR